MRTLLALIFLLSSTTSVFALTFTEVTEICPIDGAEFKDTKPASGTKLGMMLDLKPYGPTPAPWKYAQCPRDGFILYKTFTPEELASLKPYILSNEYQALRQTETQYWCLAQMQKKLGATVEIQAHSLLQATWQASEKQYPRYAKAAILLFQELFIQKGKEDNEGFAAGMLIGELQRRLGNFEAAKIIFTSLEKSAVIKDPLFATIVAQQLKLIEAKNKDTAKLVMDPALYRDANELK